MGSRLFETSYGNGSLGISVGNAIDDMMPSDEALEKYGRHCGLMKRCARHRNSVVCGITVFVVAAAIASGLLLIGLVIAGAGATAKNIIFKGPVRMPWQSEADHTRAVRQSQAFGDTITLGNGVVVAHVIEPQAMMDSVDQLLLLVAALESERSDALAAMNVVRAEDVARGYLPWRPFELAPRANFTLDHVQQLIRSEHRESDDTCVCFKSYQLPYDAVYLVARDEFLYQPVVESESESLVRISSDCQVDRLQRQAMRDPHWDEPRAFETPVAGKVSYVTERAKLRRDSFALPEYPCIKHCLSLLRVPPARADASEASAPA